MSAPLRAYADKTYRELTDAFPYINSGDSIDPDEIISGYYYVGEPCGGMGQEWYVFRFYDDVAEFVDATTGKSLDYDEVIEAYDHWDWCRVPDDVVAEFSK